MKRYIVNRLLQALPVLFLASIPVFLILHLAPGDPASLLAGEDATDEEVQVIREYLGLDKPLITQYGIWLTRVAHGELGQSYFMNDVPVEDLILQRLPATLELSIAGIILALLIAVPFGILAALKRGRWPDHLVMGSSTISIAIPNFWLGILVLLLFALWLDWLPAGGRRVAFLDDPIESLRFMILPALTLALSVAAVLVRFVRASLIEVLYQDYIRTAYAKGLPFRKILYKHALLNALIPAVTSLGVQFGQLLPGAIVVELVFSWPGLGQLILGAITGRDYQLVQGCLLVFVVIVVGTNLITDLLYGVLDPRINVSGGRR
jgi:peptide/nickel transport system permease protein